MISCHLRHTLPVLLLAIALPGAIYVSPDGDDQAPGTLAAPKRTIKTSLALLAPGDSLVLRGGVYDAANQGQPNMFDLAIVGEDILMTAYPGETPILDFAGAGSGGTFFDDVPSGDRATLAGMAFRGWSESASFMLIDDAHGVTIRDCTFDGIAPLGNSPIIDVIAVKDVTIEGCTFRGRPETSLYYAISLTGNIWTTAERFAVRDCVFNDEAALVDPMGRGAGILATNVDDLVVTGCRGFNAGSNRGPGAPLHYIELRDVDVALVSDIQFKRYLAGNDGTHPLHDADGIKIGSWMDDSSSNVSIAACELWGAGHGVHVGNDSRYVDLTYVWCDSTYDDCVFCNDGAGDVDIQFVVSHYSQDNGIDVQGDDVDVASSTIVRSKNTAINVSDSAERTTFRDVLVYDVRDPLPAPDALVFVEAAQDWSFDYNAWFDPDGAQHTFHFDGDTRSFADWQASGQDENGRFDVDPEFCDPNGRAWPIFSNAFQIAAGSALRTAGSGGGPIGALLADCSIVSVGETSSVPLPLAVVRATPNPAEGAMRLRVPSGRELLIFDAAGRRVRTIPIGSSAGTTRWDGTDFRGMRVPSGTYFFRTDDGAGGRVVVVR